MTTCTEVECATTMTYAEVEGSPTIYTQLTKEATLDDLYTEVERGHLSTYIQKWKGGTLDDLYRLQKEGLTEVIERKELRRPLYRCGREVI